MTLLKSRIYAKNDNFLSYGLKILPSLEEVQLDPNQMRNLTPFLKGGQPPRAMIVVAHLQPYGCSGWIRRMTALV